MVRALLSDLDGGVSVVAFVESWRSSVESEQLGERCNQTPDRAPPCWEGGSGGVLSSASDDEV